MKAIKTFEKRVSEKLGAATTVHEVQEARLALSRDMNALCDDMSHRCEFSKKEVDEVRTSCTEILSREGAARYNDVLKEFKENYDFDFDKGNE